MSSIFVALSRDSRLSVRIPLRSSLLENDIKRDDGLFSDIFYLEVHCMIMIGSYIYAATSWCYTVEILTQELAKVELGSLNSFHFVTFLL